MAGQTFLPTYKKKTNTCVCMYTTIGSIRLVKIINKMAMLSFIGLRFVLTDQSINQSMNSLRLNIMENTRPWTRRGARRESCNKSK